MLTHHSFAGTDVPEAYGRHSHAVVAGDSVFAAGQIARDSVTGKLIDADSATQTARCLEIIAGIPAHFDLTLADLGASDRVLEGPVRFDALNQAYRAAVRERYPARSTPQVVLPFGALVGIEVTAYRPSAARRGRTGQPPLSPDAQP